MPSRSAIASALRHLAPRLPAHEFAAVVDHAMDSPGLRVASPENAAWRSVVAYARHALTAYELEGLLAGWGAKRKLGEGD